MTLKLLATILLITFTYIALATVVFGIVFAALQRRRIKSCRKFTQHDATVAAIVAIFCPMTIFPALKLAIQYETGIKFWKGEDEILCRSWYHMYVTIAKDAVESESSGRCTNIWDI